VQSATNFEKGSNFSHGGRNSYLRDEGFNGQGFGAYEEGKFKGKNGYGNGYASMNRCNYR
jgi:hypothetical protein